MKPSSRYFDHGAFHLYLICFSAWVLNILWESEKMIYLVLLSFTGVYDVSAYCPCKKCCGPTARGITASGVQVQRGMCAAPKSIPFRTVLYIPGYGKAVVQDRGGAIKAAGSWYKGKKLRYDRLDVYFPTHKEALKWGRKVLKVEIH